MDEIIAELKERKATESLGADNPLLGSSAPPLSLGEIELAETSLGFRLPELLRRIYSEVANGGFGYSYGLLGLSTGPRNEDGQDAIGLYLAYRESDPDDLLWQWPHGLLPIGYLGCAMFHCVQCADPEGNVVWFDPNPHEPRQSWEDSFIPSRPRWLPTFGPGWTVKICWQSSQMAYEFALQMQRSCCL